MILSAIWIFIIFLNISLCSCTHTGAQTYVEKNNPLDVLEKANKYIHNIKKFVTDCDEGSKLSTVKSDKCFCELEQKVTENIELALKRIRKAKRAYSFCKASEVGSSRHSLKPEVAHPIDCLDVLQRGQKESGVYTIRPQTANKSLDVFCDMDTDGGGWTVFQRRGDFPVQEKFFRNWKDYKLGFGSIRKDFWLGNDNIHHLSNQGDTSVRFDMQDIHNERRHAHYQYFKVDDENNNYKLYIHRYSGNAGDSMATHNEMQFSTLYRKNDRDRTGSHCASKSESGWWFNDCSACNPNGLYDPGKADDTFKYMFWLNWKKHECLKAMEIKMRRLM